MEKCALTEIYEVYILKMSRIVLFVDSLLQIPQTEFARANRLDPWDAQRF